MKTPTADSRTEPTVDVRFSQVGLMQVRLRTTDPGTIVDELAGRIASAPRFFDRTAVGIDLGVLGRVADAEELRGVLAAVRRAGLIPIGLASGPAEVPALARELDLPVLPQLRGERRPPPAEARHAGAERATGPTLVRSKPPAPSADAGLPALMQNQSVRSGQRVYARARDLVVTASVASGAEVIADGCVHVYGPLRGRAMAGARGDGTARVFCQEFHAELVSIGGIFRVFETIPPELAGRPVQAWLTGEELHFARIGA